MTERPTPEPGAIRAAATLLDAALQRFQSVDMSYFPVYPGGQKQLDEDCQVMAAHYVNELNSTPVDEAWAKSVAVRVSVPYSTIYDLDDLMTVSLVFTRGGDICLCAKGCELMRSTTRGQVRTACRLFGVELKVPA